MLEHHLQNSFLQSMQSVVNKEEHHVNCLKGAANSKEMQTDKLEALGEKYVRGNAE